MKPKLRRNLSGSFMARDISAEVWRLSRLEPLPLDILVRGVHREAADAMLPRFLSDIELEWQEGVVLLTMTSEQRRVCVKARSAIVHEPLQSLYVALPLATFDSKAKRFWSRVFRLVRIPGGRYFLGLLARRSRGRG